MKKLLLVLVIAAVLGLGWTQRRSLFWLYWSARTRPPEIQFQEYRKDRIHVQHVPFLAARVPEIADRILSNLDNAEKITGTQLGKLNVRLYATFEEKGADVRDIYLAHTDPSSDSVYYIVNDTFDGTREQVEYELLLRECCGKPATPEIGRATVAALAGVWNQKTINEWTNFLQRRGFSRQDAFNLQSSEFVRIPMTAAYIRHLDDAYGREAMLEFYREGIKPNGSEAGFEQAALSLSSGPGTAPRFAPVFQKGMSYAYENGYSEGYATKKSARSLDLLKKIGVEWIASIPYGFMRSNDSPEVRTAGHSIFTESDESLFALAADARSRGIRVMVKPQLWISHSAWPGMVDFQDEKSWEQWFQSYENWILHYAIIAELSDADLFCIGTELVKTTTKHPARWRKLIARIRQVYHGPITYAANYGQEFEQMQFWDALDYMGLDNYYSVRSSPDQGMTTMQQGFLDQKERVRAVVMRWNKPLLFTEIGYNANPGAGMGSREEDIEGYDEAMQAACYRMAIETYWNEPWFYGMYWWKWFSNPEDRGAKADRHSPHGRQAEKVLAEWYLKKR